MSSKELLKVLVATNNRGKLIELTRLAQVEGLQFVTPREVELDPDFDVEETEPTFEGNATLKAVAYARATGLHAVADDSGIEVEALNGAPGVYTKRFAGENSTDAQRIAFLLDKMKDVTEDKRTARFVCALVLVAPDGSVLETQTGYCNGHIGFEPRGTNGFGYDPIFLIGDSGRTMAEFGDAEKDVVSHRGNAIRQLRPALQKLTA